MWRGEFANRLRRLEKRVHVLGCQSRGEGQHHDRAAEKANFAGDISFAQLV